MVNIKPKLRVVLKHVNKLRVQRGLKPRTSLPKGYVEQGDCCVIANCFPGDCEVDNIFIDFNPLGLDDNDGVYLSAPLKRFVVDFDKGLYPELELED